MCYLVAKNKNAHGCYALKTVHGVHLVDLKRQLNQFAVPHGIQLVTISRPNAYGEYAPYHILDSEEDFVQTVRKLCSRRRAQHSVSRRSRQRKVHACKTPSLHSSTTIIRRKP